MAEPSRTRNFFGRVVDRILPGSNYNTSTGRYSNVGTGIAGLGARLAATAFAGPAVGALVGKGAGYLIDHAGNRIGDPQRESLPVNGGSVNPGFTGGVSMPSVSNLGLGAQSPGGDWAGYLQGAGSANNFGNQGFMRPGSFTNWSPTSGWGKQLIAQQPTPGSLGGFGNNVGGFLSGGAGGARSPVASAGSRAGLTRAGGSAAGWVNALNTGEILGKFQGDPEKYTRAT